MLLDAENTIMGVKIDGSVFCSSTNDDYPGRPGGSGGGGSSNPPPPGFRSDYYPSGSSGDSCGSQARGSAGSGGGVPGGGFWTGAATGGLLGYMFGSRKYV